MSSDANLKLFSCAGAVLIGVAVAVLRADSGPKLVQADLEQPARISDTERERITETCRKAMVIVNSTPFGGPAAEHMAPYCHCIVGRLSSRLSRVQLLMLEARFEHQGNALFQVFGTDRVQLSQVNDLGRGAMQLGQSRDAVQSMITEAEDLARSVTRGCVEVIPRPKQFGR